MTINALNRKKLPALNKINYSISSNEPKSSRRQLRYFHIRFYSSLFIHIRNRRACSTYGHMVFKLELLMPYITYSSEYISKIT